MSEVGSLERLESLHRDLLSLSQSRLADVDRLWVQLETHIGEFKRLLEKSPRNEPSRKVVATGKLPTLDEEYAINEDFQQTALQLADALDLDEVEAARVALESLTDAEILGRSLLESSIIRFHQTRKYMLGSFRLMLHISSDSNVPELMRDAMREVTDQVIHPSDRLEGQPSFVAKCLHKMGDTRTVIQSLTDKLNGASLLGQIQKSEFQETIEYQRASLVQEHESLGIIVQLLVKSYNAVPKDFEQILEILKRAEKYDSLLVHLILPFSAFMFSFGAPEGVSTIREARDWNEKIIGHKDQNPWALHYVQAAICAWWLAEYGGWYVDFQMGSPLVGINLEEESKTRTKQFADCLKDGAFDFLLSLSADVKSADWQDPARYGLRQWLQRNSPALLPDLVPFSEYFQVALMEQLELFIDAFITHMPDVLRKLRVEEDEQRQLSPTHDHDLDLERFLVIMSFAFEGRPDAAQVFWSDPDSNLVGFIHWASRRTTTPLLSAFCEMLQALAEDEICATKAHEFLLGEASSSGKIMRSNSLTWDRIFRELTFYSSNLRDRPTLPKSTFYRSGKQSNDQAEAEPESAMMLESYLRLMTRLCTESTVARSFLFEHPTFNLTDLLYQLASNENVQSRLRACAFTTLRSLLTYKTQEKSEFIWKNLDAWASGSYSQAALVSRNPAMFPAPGEIMDGILQRIFSGYEECIAFVQLLQALIQPCENDHGLNDSLPFPELLGSSNRMPGIEPYVDFVAKVFQAKPAEANDHTQLRLLSITCLQFILTSLRTFNEDLVIFANQSNIAVDNAIGTSDLASYVRLHPFSRTMEWIFNDGVMAALFEALHQDATEVGNASPDSPLVLCLLYAIETVELVLNLQATYLDIVRPLTKAQPNHRRNLVANAAFASFEDGILTHLSLITDLGLYCGAGHATLTIASLKLLGLLSTSPKLVGSPSANMRRFSSRNKAIVALGSNNDSDRIARSLTNELLSNLELDEGPESDTYLIKVHILDFLYSCLEAVPGSPSIAHLLLGFQCSPDGLEISHDGPLSNGTSLLHAILNIVIEYPVADPERGLLSWLISIKFKAFQVLKALWQSTLSSDLVMAQLRDNEFLINMFGKEVILDTMTLWDGKLIDDEQFVLSSSSNGYLDFIRHRATLFQYAALELRQIQNHAPAIKEQAITALLGYSITTEGQQIESPTIFDLFEFMELEVQGNDASPELKFFEEIDLSICIEVLGDAPSTYNIKRVQELIKLRQNELRRTGYLPTPKELNNFEKETRALMAFVQTDNQLRRLAASRLQGLEAWVQLMLMIIETGGLAGETKASFVLQALQVILPKFETYCIESLDEALMLASLAKFLLFNISFSSKLFPKGTMGDLASDRLFQLFRACLQAIPSPIANPLLKEMMYSICYRYIIGMSDVVKEPATMRKHINFTIKVAGERLMDVICDDAYAGEQTCRIAALLFLGELAFLARQEDSKYIIDALIRLNFLDLVVHSIQNILTGLHESKADDLELQVAHYQAKLALLLQIAQTRFGATALVNAGFFQSIKASRLFSIDPDLDAGIARKTHSALLLAIMRVINAVVVSRGEQNEQTLALGRKFLAENRLSILTIFKRSAKVEVNGLVPSDRLVDTLAESYVLLIALTGFIDFEDKGISRSPATAFT